MKNMFKIFLVLIFVVMLGLPVLVLAEQQSVGHGQQVSQVIPDPLGGKNFTDIVNALVEWLSNIGAAIAVIMIIWSGFLFMTSGGDENKVTKARQSLTWAMIGLAVFLIGRGWVLIVKNLLGVTG